MGESTDNRRLTYWPPTGEAPASVKGDRVTLELKGTVPLDLFATAVSAFAALLKGRLKEPVGGLTGRASRSMTPG